MERRVLKALSGRDITKGRKYILIRITDSDDLVVNVMEVVTPPTLDQKVGKKLFQARGLFVGSRELTPEEGAPIELSLDDIGCPWKGSPQGIVCRTFEYGDVEHRMLVDEIARNPSDWRCKFKEALWAVHYDVHSQRQPFSQPTTSAAALLSRSW